MQNYWYSIDEDHQVHPVIDSFVSRKFDEKLHRVGLCYLGKVCISTVFLALDHRRQDIDPGPPVLFETLVSQGDDRGVTEDVQRCCTWDEAVEQHAQAVIKYWPR